MGRKATGTVRVFSNGDGAQWFARFSRADGSRTPWTPLDPSIPPDDEAGAKACAARMAPKIKSASANGGTGETCDDYFARLAKARAAEGIANVRKEKYDWSKWISPRIGKRAMATVTRDEIEDVRNLLDTEVKKRLAEGIEAGLSGKSAMNIWSTLRTTFKEAVSARDRALRVRTDDPTAGHKPPLATPERAKTFVYPCEMTTLLACEDVPRAWRETYAIATYSYARPEELEALTWMDVDFSAWTFSISKAIDARTGKPKTMPKTANAVRGVPIEPALRPLLVAMHKARSGDEAPVLPALRTMNDKFRAKLFREHLALAGVKRPRLTTDTLTLMGVNFRSCRDSGITWLALADVPLAAMQRRCGHADVSQTLAYVKLAEDLSGTIGEPFAPLPKALLGADSVSSVTDAFRPEKQAVLVPEEGVEPARRDHTGPRENKADGAREASSESSALAPVVDLSERLETEPGTEPADPVEAALAAGVRALAARIADAPAEAVPALAASLTALATELTSRRAAPARSKVVSISERRGR